MTYRKLIYLKYKKGMTTHELARQFPQAIQQVSEIALLDVPEATLREIIQEERDFLKLMRLKRQFLEGA